MSEYKFTDSDKHELKQYERMQDYVAAYAQLAIKSALIVSAGGLVSIGAAYTKFITTSSSFSSENIEIVKSSLTKGFNSFFLAVVILLAIITLVYIARVCFLIDCNSDYSDKIKKRHRSYGDSIEGLCMFIYVFALYKIYIAFQALATGFTSYNFLT